jgi:hypothetical protein
MSTEEQNQVVSGEEQEVTPSKAGVKRPLEEGDNSVDSSHEETKNGDGGSKVNGTNGKSGEPKTKKVAVPEEGVGDLEDDDEEEDDDFDGEEGASDEDGSVSGEGSEGSEGDSDAVGEEDDDDEDDE